MPSEYAGLASYDTWREVAASLASGIPFAHIDDLETETHSTEELSTKELIVGQVQRRVVELTIADDSVKSVNVSPNRGALIAVYQEDANRFGLFGTIANSCDTATSQAITNNGSLQLTGTTGTDGELSVSRDGDTFYIENRTGGQIIVHVDVKDLL